MKKFVPVLIGSVLIAGTLVGCGTQSSSDSNATASNSQGSNSNAQGYKSNHQYRGNGGQQQLNQISKILGVDTQTITNDLKAGQSIVDIAKTKGITEQQLVDQLKKQRQDQLDQAVQNGRMTQDQEQNMLANADKQIQTMVEHKGPMVYNRGNRQNSNNNNSNNNANNNGNTNNSSNTTSGT